MGWVGLLTWLTPASRERQECCGMPCRRRRPPLAAPAGAHERAQQGQRVRHHIHDGGEGVFQHQPRHVALRLHRSVRRHRATQRAAKQHDLRAGADGGGRAAGLGEPCGAAPQGSRARRTRAAPALAAVQPFAPAWGRYLAGAGYAPVPPPHPAAGPACGQQRGRQLGAVEGPSTTPGHGHCRQGTCPVWLPPASLGAQCHAATRARSLGLPSLRP